MSASSVTSVKYMVRLSLESVGVSAAPSGRDNNSRVSFDRVSSVKILPSLPTRSVWLSASHSAQSPKSVSLR